MNKEWVQHIEKSKRMSDESLHKAFREYGTHNFMIKQLDECEEREFEIKLNQWIDKYKPEYNEIKVDKVEEPIKERKQRPYIPAPHLQRWNSETRGNGKHFGLKIRGKNLQTGICTDYESARVAAEMVTGKANNNSNILLAARTGRTAYGHKWQILEEKKKKRSVFGVNKKTEQIEVRFESVSGAVRSLEGTNRNGIIKSLKNPGRFSWKGYYWFYT